MNINPFSFYNPSFIGSLPVVGIVKIACDGNSLTAGHGASSGPVASPTTMSGTDYPADLNGLLDARYVVYNFGIPGQTTTDMASDVTSQVDVLFASAKKCILVAWEITNALVAGTTDFAAYEEFKAYCVARRAIGWKVITINVLTRTAILGSYSTGDFEVVRLAINAKMAAEWPSFADKFVDVSALGVSLPDGVHTNDAGYASIAAAVRTQVASVILSSSYTGTFTPTAPTTPTVNDTTKAFGWTNSANYTAFSDYEVSVNSGSAWTTAGANPYNVGGAGYAIGLVQVRVRAGSGRNVSSVISNATAFTAGATTVALILSTSSGGTVTESPTGTFRTDGSGSSLINFTTSLAADGWIEMLISDVSNGGVNQGTVLGLSTNNTLEPYSSMPFGVFIFNGVYQRIDTGTPIDCGVAAVVGDLCRVNRVGSTITIGYYRSGAWTLLYTFAGSSTGTAYGKVHILNANNYLYNPKGFGFA